MLKRIQLCAKHLLLSVKDQLHWRGKAHCRQSPTLFDGVGQGGMALPLAGATSAHATNRIPSVDEGEAGTTSSRPAVSSASSVQIPTQQTNTPNRSENSSQPFSHRHIHTRKHKKLSSTMEGPNPGPMDPPGGGRIPDRFLISIPSRQLMPNVRDGQTSIGGLRIEKFWIS